MLKNIGLLFFFLFFSFFGVKEGFCDIITIEKQLKILNKHIYCFATMTTVNEKYNESNLKKYYDSLLMLYAELKAILRTNFKTSNDGNFQTILTDKINKIKEIKIYLNKIKNFDESFKTNTILETCNNTLKNITYREVNRGIDDILASFDFYKNNDTDLTKIDFGSVGYNSNVNNIWAKLILQLNDEDYNLNLNILKYIIYNYRLSNDIKCYDSQQVEKFNGILNKPLTLNYTLANTLLLERVDVTTDLRQKYKSIHQTCLTRNGNGTVGKYNDNDLQIKENYLKLAVISESFKDLYTTMLKEQPVKITEEIKNGIYTEKYFQEKYNTKLLFLQKRELLLEIEKDSLKKISNNIEAFLSGYSDTTDECIGAELIFNNKIQATSKYYKRNIKQAIEAYFLGKNNIDLLIIETFNLKKFIFDNLIMEQTKILNQIMTNDPEFDATVTYNRVRAYKSVLVSYLYKYENNFIQDSSMKTFLKELIADLDLLLIKIIQQKSGLIGNKTFKQNGVLYGMCYVIKLIHGAFGKTIACFAIIMLGGLLLSGKIEFKTLISIVLAFCFTFGSVSVAEMLFPNQISCQTLDIDPDIHI